MSGTLSLPNADGVVNAVEPQSMDIEVRINITNERAKGLLTPFFSWCNCNQHCCCIVFGQTATNCRQESEDFLYCAVCSRRDR